jgi:ABC-type polar amino acid transport system ATPase subunit
MIFPLLTVRENLETGFACLPRAERKVPDHIYELFPVLKDMRNRRGGDLSGGQQQQLAIARALITRPKLLLLDEPTEGIQPNIIQQIGRVIALLSDQGEMAIVLVEQYFDFAYGLADRFCVARGSENGRRPRKPEQGNTAGRGFGLSPGSGRTARNLGVCRLLGIAPAHCECNDFNGFSMKRRRASIPTMIRNWHGTCI